MTIPHYARVAAKLLQRERDSLPVPAPATPAVRDQTLAAIESALVVRNRRQRLRRVTYASLGAAALFGLAWFVRGTAPLPASPPPASATAGVARSLGVTVHAFGSGARISGGGASGDQLGPGGRVQAFANGHVLLAFATGTRVSVEPEADVTLVENGAAQVLALDRGGLRADVAKLAPGRRFLVQTPDSEVEVHGTSFRVSTQTDAARCGTRALTRVEVFEGVVTVRNGGSERRIERGGQWQTACSTPPVAEEASLPKIEPTGSAPQGNARAHHAASVLHAPPLSPRAATPASSPPVSQLTEQNDAFAAAVSAEQAGELARAVRGFDSLITRFPAGPLAESAAVQRLKITQRFDRARALELAREYLKDYPGGFARAEAMAVVAGSP